MPKNSNSSLGIPLKKYVLEDFLEKIKKLTPIQSSRQNFKYSNFTKKRDFRILKETKLLHQKRKDLSKIWGNNQSFQTNKHFYVWLDRKLEINSKITAIFKNHATSHGCIVVHTEPIPKFLVPRVSNSN